MLPMWPPCLRLQGIEKKPKENMHDIAIYGFGGLGREITTLIYKLNQQQQKWNFRGYFDDGYAAGTSNNYGKVLGGLQELNAWPSPLNVVLAIANGAILQKLSELITNPNVSFPNILAPDVFLFDASTLQLGRGNLITYGCRISCDVKLGDFNILNGCISLGHDVHVGNYNIFFPDVRISGETTIGNHNLFGAGSFVLQRIKIGNHIRLAPGSYLLRNAKDNYLYMGNPAKRTENN